jgi:surface polysaccharide O-acyltransferase-like enzyme
MTPAENLSADHTSQRPPPLDLKDLKEPSSAVNDEQWTLCCSKSSKQFVMYLTQTVVLMSVLIFAIAMLASAQEGQNRDLYVSLLSSVLGIYLPAPQILEVK